MCKDAPGIDTVLKQFTGFISNAPLIAHNAPFDTKFIKHILKLLNLPDINNEIIDTLRLSRELFPDQSHKLNILSKNLGLGHDNPHRAVDDTYATLNLYEKICQVKNTRINFFLQDHLDLVTLGTISDMMPLISENRVIVKHGLQQLQHTRKKGIAYLMEYLGRRTNIDTITLKHISFNLIPVLNSCGRLDQANFALDLLITEDSKKTADLLERVFFLNEERKNIQVILIDQIKKLIGEQCDINNDKLLFIADPENSLQTPEGLIGMITTRFAYLYNKPVIIISGSAGAARSVNEFNILQLLTQCKGLLTRFGGHNQAAGFSIQPAKISEFRAKINILLQSQDYADSVELVLKIDTELAISDINRHTIEELDKLEPFGHGNPSPAFMIKNVKLQKHEKSGNKLYLNIIKDNNMIIGSCQDFDIDNLKLSAYFDIAFQINTSKTAKKNNELVILDIKPSAI